MYKRFHVSLVKQRTISSQNGSRGIDSWHRRIELTFLECDAHTASGPALLEQPRELREELDGSGKPSG